MILLTSTSDLIQVITGSALSTTTHVSWVDLISTTVTPGRTNTSWSTASTQTVVGSPASSTSRNVKSLVIRNADASSSNTITVQHTDGSTVAVLYKCTLLAGCSLVYSENDGFTVMDSSGGRSISPSLGRLIKVNVLTSGTGATFTTSASTNSIMVELVGGGGGGGGCSSVASAAAAAGGGGCGGYAKKYFSVTPNTGYTYTVGAAGNGSSGAAGGNGTASTFAVGATTVTANLGTGGPLATATVTTGTGFAGGDGGAVSTNGDVNGAGAPGGAGIMTAVTPLGASGCGGSGLYGKGGLALVAAGAGNNAAGFGGGGGGSLTGASAARAGGNGVGGVIIVYEYT
jgi:hypothetical protein